MGARRAAAALVLVASATIGIAPIAYADPSPAPTQNPQQACQQLDPLSPTGFAGRFGCDVVTGGPAGPVQDAASSAGHAAQQAGQAAFDAAESNFTNWVAAGAAWVTDRLLSVVAGPSTTPDLNPAQAAAFAHVYGRVVGVALSLSMLLVLLGIIEAVLTQRPGGLRRVVVGIAVAGIGLGAVPAATAILLRIVDDLSQYLLSGQTQTITQGLQTTIQILKNGDATQTGGAAFAWTAFGVLAAGTVLWLELLMRESLVFLYLGVAPLACAAVQWPRLEGVMRQVLFAGLALILSKLVIAVALSVGFALMATSGTGLETLLAGMFVLLLAALTPFTLARVLPLAAEELSHSHQGRMRGTATTAAASTTRAITGIAAGAINGGFIPTSLGAAPTAASAAPNGSGRRQRPGQSGPGAPAHVAAGTGTAQAPEHAAAGPSRRRAAPRRQPPPKGSGPPQVT
jgi:hypothetical protein